MRHPSLGAIKAQIVITWVLQMIAEAANQNISACFPGMLLLGVSTTSWYIPRAPPRPAETASGSTDALKSRYFACSSETGAVCGADALMLADHHGGVTVTRFQFEQVLLLGCMRCLCFEL
jgi:hypothetical protein